MAEENRKWTTDEVREEFEVISFMAPLVFVTRKSDGVEGTLTFDHSPRIYYDFVERKRG